MVVVIFHVCTLSCFNILDSRPMDTNGPVTQTLHPPHHIFNSSLQTTLQILDSSSLIISQLYQASCRPNLELIGNVASKIWHASAPKAAHMNFCEHYASEVDTADTFLKENDANITIYTSNSVQIADTHRGEEERKP
jgi:hypothetical protein